MKKINCDFTAHDAIPYGSSDSDDVYRPLKEEGYFIPTLRSEGISTSDIINRILKDRDEYILRNLKKGNTADDLNLDLYECIKYGVRPSKSTKLNQLINKVLDFKLVAKLAPIRQTVVKLLCSKKPNKSKQD